MKIIYIFNKTLLVGIPYTTKLYKRYRIIVLKFNDQTFIHIFSRGGQSYC